MKRVMVVGSPGAGKSTLARAIGAATGLPIVHLDMIHWMPGWTERDTGERNAMIDAAEKSERWVIDGNYRKTWTHRVGRADTFVWIDLPVGLRLRRVIRRVLRSYGRNRPDLPEGCPERFSAEFLWYIWSTRNSGRRAAVPIAADPPAHLTVHHLRSVDEVTAFTEGLGA